MVILYENRLFIDQIKNGWFFPLSHKISQFYFSSNQTHFYLSVFLFGIIH